MKTTHVHSYPIVAFIRTEIYKGDDCGIIVIERGSELDYEFVTAWYKDGDREWVHGNYGFKKLSEAINDMIQRANQFVNAHDEKQFAMRRLAELDKKEG